MGTMKYKGYSASIEYSDEDSLFLGDIAGISDVVSFRGESVKEIRCAFVQAVDHYLYSCESLDRIPQRPYSGKISLRIAPELHSAVALKAQWLGKSINQWIADELSKAAHG
ncbi:type II toxin-antitoxin system HicB family antitoxin [Pseudomonas rhodesiae]|uniref:type II toxin-antitoxin system HicB family antitoxin n=1 Tax=Pseudomonas rhodesiae TaxID=76760 RepID=UPI002898D164|nr:type II toxin-antitoxin system HicB family antitoxin [Pseudomonas rhodesiae]